MDTYHGSDHWLGFRALGIGFSVFNRLSVVLTIIKYPSRAAGLPLKE
jgi:hypothetical protein